MRARRILWFLVMIAVGILLGMIYGWVIHPIRQVNASPANLRYDYKADAVLMAAEIYHADGDLTQARQRLMPLGSQPAQAIAAEALETARSLQYAPEDLEIMTALADALKATSDGETQQP